VATAKSFVDVGNKFQKDCILLKYS
jgi:hypothetical protein